MKKERNYKLTHEILEQYQSAALENAQDLVREAHCLLRSQYWSRAYFLSCSSIEETGKAIQAFLARGKNLRNPSVEHRIKLEFEHHGKKNMAALLCLVFHDREKIKDEKFVNFIVDTSLALQVGREKSMYVDISNSGKITVPNAIVPERNAKNTVYLAQVLLDTVKEYTLSNTQHKTSTWQEKFFVIPPEKCAKMMQERDFFEFAINKASELKRFDIVELAVKYYEGYFCKNKPFQEVDN